MAKPTLSAIKSATEHYAELRQKLAQLKADYDEAALPIEEDMAKLELALIMTLKNAGWHETPEAYDGSRFRREVKTSFKIIDEEKAYEWAAENNAIGIVMTKATPLLKRAIITPPGFEQKETEYLKIKKSNDKADAE